MHPVLGDPKIRDIKYVGAFDIDRLTSYPLGQKGLLSFMQTVP